MSAGRLTCMARKMYQSTEFKGTEPRRSRFQTKSTKKNKKTQLMSVLIFTGTAIPSKQLSENTSSLRYDVPGKAAFVRSPSKNLSSWEQLQKIFSRKILTSEEHEWGPTIARFRKAP
jgi:hypothetical protein